MPDRISLIYNLLEVILLNTLNILLFIGWNAVFGGITFFLSTIYSIGRIRRDVNKYHNGSFKSYKNHIIGRTKKN